MDYPSHALIANWVTDCRYGRRAISANTESELLTNLRYRFRNVQDSTFTSTYLDRLTTSTRQRGVNYVLV